MKRKSLADLPPDEREFIDGGKPKPDLHAPISRPPLVSAVPPEIPRVTQTYRLPQSLVHELLRASTERKLERIQPWAQQDIVAEALKDWLNKHTNK